MDEDGKGRLRGMNGYVAVGVSRSGRSGWRLAMSGMIVGWFCCCALAVGGGQVAAQNKARTEVQNVRMWRSPERTRVVFDLSAPVQYHLFELENPHRVVVDIRDAHSGLDMAAIAVTGAPLRGVRSGSREGGTLRVVLDLTAAVEVRHFLLAAGPGYGDRLVVDLYDVGGKQAVPEPQVELPEQKIKDVVVAIDAGHGGEDPGAIGHNKVFEKNVVLAISRWLAALFDDAPGYRPVLIRDGDYYVAHRRRTGIAHEHRAHLFVSIHADSFTSAKVNGASVYAISQQGASSETARQLAEKENRADLIGGVDEGGVVLADYEHEEYVQETLLDLVTTGSLVDSLNVGKSVLDAMGEVTRLHKSHVEQAAFLVLKSPDIPSILVETGFISNPRDARNLSSRQYQRSMAAAIFKGVDRYMRANPPDGTWLAALLRGRHIEYVIERGDTLSAIATRYRVSSEHLKQLNGLRSDVIRAGQVLRIPTG